MGVNNFNMSNIDTELIELDHQALFTMANWHDKQATILRERAFTLASRAQDQNDIDRRLKFLDRLPDTVMKYLRQGCTLSEAQNKAAAHANCLLATVEARWHKFIDVKDEKSLAKRNRLIMDLAALNLTNQMIADRVGLHPVSVSRIISKEKRSRLSFERGSLVTEPHECSDIPRNETAHPAPKLEICHVS